MYGSSPNRCVIRYQFLFVARVVGFYGQLRLIRIRTRKSDFNLLFLSFFFYDPFKGFHTGSAVAGVVGKKMPRNNITQFSIYGSILVTSIFY